MTGSRHKDERNPAKCNMKGTDPTAFPNQAPAKNQEPPRTGRPDKLERSESTLSRRREADCPNYPNERGS